MNMLAHLIFTTLAITALSPKTLAETPPEPLYPIPQSALRTPSRIQVIPSPLPISPTTRMNQAYQKGDGIAFTNALHDARGQIWNGSIPNKISMILLMGTCEDTEAEIKNIVNDSNDTDFKNMRIRVDEIRASTKLIQPNLPEAIVWTDATITAIDQWMAKTSNNEAAATQNTLTQIRQVLNRAMLKQMSTTQASNAIAMALTNLPAAGQKWKHDSTPPAPLINPAIKPTNFYPTNAIPTPH